MYTRCAQESYIMLVKIKFSNYKIINNNNHVSVPKFYGRL